jgi:uncharacterized repeat protein (TIGR03943 family)
MSEDARATTVLLVGALLIRLSLSHAYARYVRTGMGGWLLVAGILLALLGLAGVIRAFAARVAAPDPHGDHDHGTRVGWLLLAPVLALLLVTPPALGSFGVDRNATVSVTSGGKTFASLPRDRITPMSLLEFDERAADHDGASMRTTPVRLTGFVARPNDGAGFRLARYQIACCAADAIAAIVRVTGTIGTPPARDRWVTVTGTFNGSPGGVPELRAAGLTEIPAPPDPYE